MQNTNAISIDLDKVLFTLFCVYAFSMPFELILEVLFGIDTIFKPFRVISLLIIGVYGIKVLRQGMSLDVRNNADWLLYGVFIYGILISLFRMIGGVFNMGLFMNDLFQSGLYVMTFFIYKTLLLTKEQALIIIYFFIAGLLVNSSYSFFEFLLYYDRQAGFTDNPNYVAFGLVAGTTFLLLKTNYKTKLFHHFIFAIFILFMIYMFGIAGSRTGLIMFIVANFFVIFFANIKRKVVIFFISLLVSILLFSNQLTSSSMGFRVPLIERVLNNIHTEGRDIRFTVWEGVFKILEDRGYAGIGIGQYKANFAQYYSEVPDKLILEIVNRGYFLSTHNDYLAILTDYGLPSLVLYVAFLFFTLMKGIKKLNYPSGNDNEKLLAQFNFSFFICIIIFGIAAENFQHQLYWFFLMFTTKYYS